jgi:uncharacterized membrane protein
MMVMMMVVVVVMVMMVMTARCRDRSSRRSGRRRVLARHVVENARHRLTRARGDVIDATDDYLSVNVPKCIVCGPKLIPPVRNVHQ